MKKIYHTPTMTIMAVALNEMVALSTKEGTVTEESQVWVRGEEPNPWSSVLEDEW